MLSRFVCIVAILALGSAPASAELLDFTQQSKAGTTSSPMTFSSGGVTVALSAYTFANGVNPATLGGSNIGSPTFSSSILSYSDRGVGVCSSGETGGPQGNSEGCPEVDSADEQSKKVTNYNEGLLLTFTGAPTVNLLGTVLNRVDQYDTLGIYGVSTLGNLAFLGFAGTIMNPTNGFTVAKIGSNTNTQHVLTFTPALQGYSRYFFTTTTNSSLPTRGDGYRLAAMTVAAVPEPATWAMMLIGFGFIGMQMRRSRRRFAVAV
ncbi:PEPxxWA-CTERM sorting domain-containing protein [Sphingomonas mesophila]|uniref:PEPxxWA-CTERM sorting domain-containing protein n=1 Tax=Sphingomonas mesophila TaxID=2303576 RepID=UPI001F074927|nr:PEPxxWA-CTERM sorting domain-containing protein [Sphingomonas mesophila]